MEPLSAVLGVVVLVIYFVPTVVAFSREHAQKIPILLLNIFLAGVSSAGSSRLSGRHCTERVRPRIHRRICAAEWTPGTPSTTARARRSDGYALPHKRNGVARQPNDVGRRVRDDSQAARAGSRSAARALA